jgi:phospholipid/cholesterol/gamma-HCH transport system substrate-binding protein
MSDQFKFRRVNEITGIFVIAVIALAIAAIVWTARSQRWFKSTVSLRIVLPEEGAAGIRPGSEVYFLGTLIGSVSDVLVEPTGRMEANARVRRDFFRFVRADSWAVVKKKFGVAGDSYFEVTRGMGKTLPEGNASIVCNEQFQSSLESAIEEIRSKAVLLFKHANTGLETWNHLGEDLRGTQQKLDHLTSQLDAIAASIQAGNGTAGKLIRDPAIANETLSLISNANEAITQSRAIMTNLNVAVGNIQEGVARFPEIANTLADEAQDLPGLVQQSQTSMRELERLVVALQHHWLVRKYMSKAETSPASIRLEHDTTKKSQAIKTTQESNGTR